MGNRILISFPLGFWAEMINNYFLGIYKSVIVFVIISAAFDIVSDKVGWACIVKPMSSGVAPISIATIASFINSPALCPIIPIPKIWLFFVSHNIFVLPLLLLIDNALAFAAQGNSPLL